MKKPIVVITAVFISAVLFCSCTKENLEVDINTEQSKSDVSISETQKDVTNVYVRDLKWGMLLDDVKSQETEKITDEALVDKDLKSEKTELKYSNIEFPTFLGDLSCKSDMILGVYTTKGLNEITYNVVGDYALQAYNTFYTFLVENGFEDLDKDVIDMDNVKLRSGYNPNDKIYATISYSESDGNLSSRITFVPETFSLKDSEEITTVLKSSASSDSSTMGEKNALAQAKNYLNIMSFSYSGLVEQLEYDEYTHFQAVHGAEANGY